jgi:hypothetical protein
MAAPSASATQSSASVTQLSASAATSARVVSSLVEMRREVVWCGRLVRRMDGRMDVMCCGAGASFCC